MKHGLFTVISGLIVFTMCSVWTPYAYGSNVWGENFGPVAATVERADAPGGLAIRSEPSAESSVIGYLAVGTRVRGFRHFENGWMRMSHPSDRGWIPVDNLVPLSSKGHVSVADTRDCTTVRSGPSERFKSVGCLPVGKELTLTGIWSENNWAQIQWPIRGWLPAQTVSTRFKPRESLLAESQDVDAEPPRKYETRRQGGRPYAYRGQPHNYWNYWYQYPTPDQRLSPYPYREEDEAAGGPRWGLDEEPAEGREPPGRMGLGPGSYGVTLGPDQILRFQIGGVGGWVDLRGAIPRHPYWYHPPR